MSSDKRREPPRRGSPVACVPPLIVTLAAVALALSDLLVTFELTPVAGEVAGEQEGGDRHGYANVLLAAAALAAMAFALAAGSRPAAVAVAVLGAAALALFLAVDIPDAGEIGAVEDLVAAEAEPRAGFWLGAAAAVALTAGGIALSTYSDGELRAACRRRDAEAPGGGRRPGVGGSAPG